MNHSIATGRSRRTTAQRLQTDAPPMSETKVGREIQPQANGCWLWKGQREQYGNTTVDGRRKVQVHRYVYTILVGEIPEGHHLHHKCQTPGCCNPAHLEPLTPKEHKAAHGDLDVEERPMAYRFDIYRATDGWRWRMVAGNGEIVADSGEAYDTKSNAQRATETLKAEIRDGDAKPHVES